MPRGGVDDGPRDAGRADAPGRAAGRDPLGGDPTRGTWPERGTVGRFAGRPDGMPEAGVPAAGVAGAVRGDPVRRPGPLGGTGRRGEGMASIVPSTRATSPDVRRAGRTPEAGHPVG